MIKCGTERERQTETGICPGERIQMRERERGREGDRERQGWERDRVTGV